VGFNAGSNLTIHLEYLIPETESKSPVCYLEVVRDDENKLICIINHILFNCRFFFV
jgi:hypothetical protein